ISLLHRIPVRTRHTCRCAHHHLSFHQRGILWPTEPLKVRAPRAQQDSRFGNMSLIPLRGTENEMRRSVAAFSTDPLTLLGNV
ncbi:hypothetical protein FKM82_027870, partial [Ascaphus truei]